MHVCLSVSWVCNVYSIQARTRLIRAGSSLEPSRPCGLSFHSSSLKQLTPVHPSECHLSHSLSLFTSLSLPPRLLLRPCCLEHCVHAKRINMPIRAQGSEQKWLLGEYQSISEARSLSVWDWTRTCWQNARSGCVCPHEAAWEMSRACQNKNTHIC